MKMQLKGRRIHTVADIQHELPTTTRTHDHKNTNITTPNVNTAMSLGTLPYQV
jgi:hypothetical protein